MDDGRNGIGGMTDPDLDAIVTRLVRYFHLHYDDPPSQTIRAIVHQAVRLAYNRVLRDRIDALTNPATGNLQVEGFYVDAMELYWLLALDVGLLVSDHPALGQRHAAPGRDPAP